MKTMHHQNFSVPKKIAGSRKVGQEDCGWYNGIGDPAVVYEFQPSCSSSNVNETNLFVFR